MSVEEPNDPRSWQIANNQIQLTELATYEERAPEPCFNTHTCSFQMGL